MPKNIFEKLLNCEDDYSDALCNLLSFDEMNKILITLLDIENLKSIDNDNIVTRLNTNKFGNPDIKYEDEKICIIFEVKINTWQSLTDNQPNGYLSYLAEFTNKEKYIVLLAPVGYSHQDKFTSRYNSWMKNKKIDIKLKYLAWQDICHEIFKNETNQTILDFAKSLDDLTYKKEFVFMDKKEFFWLENNSLLTILKKFQSAVDYVHCELKKQDKYIIQSEDSDKDDYSFTIFNKEKKPLIWFGRWNELWEKKGYALVVGCHEYHILYKDFSGREKYREHKFEPLTKELIHGNDLGKSLLDLTLSFLKK